MDQNLNIKVEGDNKVITLLTGPALEEKAPETIEVSGILGAPAQFLEKKKELYEPQNCHLLIDRKKREIIFNINDTNAYGHQIKGALVVSEVLEKFKINSSHMWGIIELQKFLRTVKMWFDVREDCDKIIEKLRDFSANINTSIENKNNDQGYKKSLLERNVKGPELPKFKLNLPIFEGYENKTFWVEIGIDPSDSSVRFFLLSDDLYELFESEKTRIINQEIKPIVDWGCSVVYLS